MTPNRERTIADVDPGSRAAHPALGEPSADTRDRRILWATGDDTLRERVRRLLEQRYEVQVLRDGRAALEAALTAPPGLVLGDESLPTLGSFDLLRGLRAHPTLAEVPVLVLLNRGLDGAWVEAVEAGADDCLAKPFEDRELLARVESRLRVARRRREANEALRESEARYRALAELSPDPTLVILEGCWAYANHAAVRLIGGRSPEDVVGGSVFAFVEPEYHAKAMEEIRAVIEEGRVNPLTDYRARRLDGSTVDVEAAGAPVTWNGRRAVQVVVRDVTEKKEGERALREAKELAERASVAKSRFLSTMSHELRTPLQAVIGLSRVMGSELAGPLNELQKEHLDRILANAWYLVDIIDEILTFSRAEAGKDEVRLAEVDLTQVARGVVEMLSSEAAAQGLELRLASGERTAVTRTDPGKVRQILTNLLGNAIRYTEAGGVDVSVAADGEGWHVRVVDTGPGIPTDRLDEIFEPFVQVDVSPGRKSGGTGLGLAIARRLARLLGGDVTVESSPGRGSAFSLRLPGRPDAP